MVQWVIAEVMADHDMDPKDVVARFRRHSVYGWGTFKCSECHLSWSSQITWVTLDIKEQRIRRRFKQKCKKCGEPRRPWWHVEEFAYMMEFALERYQKLISGTWKPTGRSPVKITDNAPHKSELCERCGFGSRKCWLIQNDNEKDVNESPRRKRLRIKFNDSLSESKETTNGNGENGQDDKTSSTNEMKEPPKADSELDRVEEDKQVEVETQAETEKKNDPNDVTMEEQKSPVELLAAAVATVEIVSGEAND